MHWYSTFVRTDEFILIYYFLLFLFSLTDPSHTYLSADPQKHQIYSYLSSFGIASPSALNCSSARLCMAYSSTLFMSPLKCEHIREPSLTTLSIRTLAPLFHDSLCFLFCFINTHQSLYIFICYSLSCYERFMGMGNFSCSLLYFQYLEHRVYF